MSLGHNHAHHQGHSHNHTVDSYGRAFYLGISLNLLFAGIELFWGNHVSSLALMTDAIHNFGDVLGLILAYFGFILAKTSKSTNFTFGLRKFSILAAFLNALILIGGTLWLMKEAIERFQASEIVPGLSLIVVAGLGIFINFFTALLFYRGSQHDLNMKGAYLHLLADAAVSVCVVVAGGFILWKGWMWVDPVMSFFIGLVILWGTWSLLKESTVLVLGGVPKNINLEEVQKFLKLQKNVDDVHDLHVWAMSTTEVALTAHLLMKSGHPGDKYLADLSHELIHKFEIHHSTFQVEIGDTDKQCYFQEPGSI